MPKQQSHQFLMAWDKVYKGEVIAQFQSSKELNSFIKKLEANNSDQVNCMHV